MHAWKKLVKLNLATTTQAVYLRLFKIQLCDGFHV